MDRFLSIDALITGAAAGLVAEALVLRMNPEVAQTVRGVLVGMPLWASWGMLLVGVPLLLFLAALQRFRPQPDRWVAPELLAVVFVAAAVLSGINAKLHARLLQGSAHRVLVQDAVVWSAAVVVAVLGGAVIRRSGGGRRVRVAFAAVMLALPVMRVVWAPTPPRQYLEVEAKPLGQPTRPLVVIGLDGLDTKVLLADATSQSLATLSRLREEGARTDLAPHRPYLRWALWTSVATGTYPGRHGVKAHWGWDFPLVFPETLRLLPWTPEGSRMILPWALAERVPPPPATVAPLWARLSASGVSTAVFGWPGSWGDDPALQPGVDLQTMPVLEPTMSASLEAALEDLPERRAQIWDAIVHDQARVDAAREALSEGRGDVWIHLESLFLARTYHEPLRPRHSRERRFLELVMELVDDQLGTILGAADPSALVAVVSPYGLSPPGSFERIKRFFGGGESWHTSAEGCPDGLLILLGDGVETGHRGPAANPPDVAPTLCYLLGLPVAQYMEGGVVVEAVTPSFLAENPLRVVD
jgi:hypothetical protein